MRLTHKLSTPIASALGRMVAAHSLLEFQLAHSLYKLAGVSQTIGRVAIPAPRGSEIVERMQQLFDARCFDSQSFPWSKFRKLLDALKSSRDKFTHGAWLYNKNVRRYILVVTSGNRQKKPFDKESTSRRVRPEGIAVTVSELRSLKAEIEKAIAQAIFLDLLIDSRLQNSQSTWPNKWLRQYLRDHPN